MRELLTEVGSDLASLAATLPLIDLASQMNMVGGAAEAPFPLNVGLLFFNPEPHWFFPATQIDVVWFPDGAGGDRFTEKTFRGPLHRMVREALEYVRRNYINETVIKHADRAEATRVVNFPYAAVEEAIVNAIYHRSYEEREPVEVRITPHELAVLSFPGPDRSIRLDQLQVAGRSPAATATGGSASSSRSSTSRKAAPRESRRSSVPCVPMARLPRSSRPMRTASRF